ncbi:MAG: hypothetical protein KOO62_10365 [candidate division Zixibacteria bacterium]|nr:hypothetical protein [candidate division Zixibacteria bacterium]
MQIGYIMKITTGFLVAIIGLVAGLSVLGCWQSDEEIALRKFPYPYRAALSICSDIDRTTSIEKFLEIQEFLNSDKVTAYGSGLGLDIGNSFWFYNQYYQKRMELPASDSLSGEEATFDPNLGISLFVGTSDSLWSHAGTMVSLIRSGHLDCLHSYGHFQENGFSRELAIQAIDLFESESLAVDVFINHGAEENQNNIGEASWFLGDNPSTDIYHADLTVSMGIKFLWRGHLSHCIGQDGCFSIVNLAKQGYEFIQDLMYTEQSYPHDNKLVHVCELDDGQKVFEFVRYNNPWGKYSNANEEFFAHQLGPDQVDDLVEKQGYMIFYTHLGTNPHQPYLSPSTVDALRYIEEKHDRGELLVATTSQLLNYYVNQKHLFWREENRHGSLHIMIDSIANEVEGSYVPSHKDLAGITFYVPEDCDVVLSVNGEPVPFVRNVKDQTGKESVSIPWRRLAFPDSETPLPQN